MNTSPAEQLRITLIQTVLHWEDVAKNVLLFTEQLNTISKDSTDLIMLPEMFASGFTMEAHKVAQTMDGNVVGWMREQAIAKNAIIAGSLVIEENKKYYNRLIWMRPDGSCATYDKRHLFRMGNEDKTYTPGEKRIVELIKGWRICPLICYDLRFPVWSRNCDEYDVLLYIANWPEPRSYAWKQLLIARAIENQCYVVGLNRVGIDGNGMNYTGDSAVLNYKGMPIIQLNAHENSIITSTLNWSELAEFRKIFPANLDADEFKILI